MLDINIVTVHPAFVQSYLGFGVCRSASEQGLAQIGVIDLRDFAIDDHGSVDDRPYGGGDGMVMRPEPLASAVKSFENKKPYVILTSPAGKLWCHDDSKRLSLIEDPLLFICGRFSGVDQRFIDSYVDEEISIGNYIVSGGELPALILIDSLLRHVPGVLGHPESAIMDSFAEGLSGGIEYPLYTRPPVFEGVEVPSVLLSGDHKKIETWRQEKSREQTKKFHQK